MSNTDPSQCSICTLHCMSAQFTQYASRTNTKSYAITKYADNTLTRISCLLHKEHHCHISFIMKTITIIPCLHWSILAKIEGAYNQATTKLAFYSNETSTSNQPPSVAPRSGATRELIALRLERVCFVLFTPIHLQIRIDNFFGIAEFRYLYGFDTGNQSRSNLEPNSTVEKYVVVIVDIEKIQKVKVNRENASFVDIKVIF